MTYKWPSRSFRKLEKKGISARLAPWISGKVGCGNALAMAKRAAAAESQRSQDHHISTMDHQGSGPVMLMFKNVETKHHQHYNGYLTLDI